MSDAIGVRATRDAFSCDLWGGFARRSRILAKGEFLYRPGDALRGIYLVLEGAFKTASTGFDGNERIVGFHLPGEVIGLDGWSEFRHRCVAIALADACVCQFSIDQFMQTELVQNGIREWTRRIIGNCTRNEIEHLEMLGRRQPVERIALFLHELMRRSQQPVEAGACVTLPMSREDIACFLGLAPETVSRGFTRLQTMGAISVDHRHIEVCDATKLQSFAHSWHQPPMRRPRVA